MSLHIKSLFRDGWPVSQLSGLVYWQKEADEWLIGGNNLSVHNPHLNVKADIKLWMDNQGNKRQVLMTTDINVGARPHDKAIVEENQGGPDVGARPLLGSVTGNLDHVLNRDMVNSVTQEGQDVGARPRPDPVSGRNVVQSIDRVIDTDNCGKY